MTFIDLTHTFTAKMPCFPGDAIPELRQIARVEKDGFTEHWLSTGMHVGTHVDAPWHMVKGGAKLSEIPLDRFFGRGVLVDVRGKMEIEESVLDKVSLNKGEIVLLWTGWSEKFGQKDYYEDYPVVTVGFAKRLVNRGVKMLGLDSPSPDKAPYPVHKILLSQGILILENLRGLEKLQAFGPFEVIALPPKLETDGGMVRVVAKKV